MRDLFRVALVHLAAVGLDKKFRHWKGRKQYTPGRPSLRREYPLFITEIFRIKSHHAGKSRQVSSNRNHRRQRPLSDGGVTGYQRTQRPYAIRVTVGHARWRKAQRAPGLFFAAAWARPSDFAARNQPPSQHLCP